MKYYSIINFQLNKLLKAGILNRSIKQHIYSLNNKKEIIDFSERLLTLKRMIILIEHRKDEPLFQIRRNIELKLKTIDKLNSEDIINQFNSYINSYRPPHPNKKTVPVQTKSKKYPSFYQPKNYDFLVRIVYVPRMYY